MPPVPSICPKRSHHRPSSGAGPAVCCHVIPLRPQVAPPRSPCGQPRGGGDGPVTIALAGSEAGDESLPRHVSFSQRKFQLPLFRSTSFPATAFPQPTRGVSVRIVVALSTRDDGRKVHRDLVRATAISGGVRLRRCPHRGDQPRTSSMPRRSSTVFVRAALHAAAIGQGLRSCCRLLRRVLSAPASAQRPSAGDFVRSAAIVGGLCPRRPPLSCQQRGTLSAPRQLSAGFVRAALRSDASSRGLRLRRGDCRRASSTPLAA